ncbi:hypothetical protein AGOR_G00226820 [Albula goreensis]|uniref:Uncharacterized protein n=1 Tax=Albula goreensis TaxID=1534307 RepID=A0A8T3CKY2_9TELE|nr:hypothetical protein AGOR_G00226820 [Albula goreensis]
MYGFSSCTTFYRPVTLGSLVSCALCCICQGNVCATVMCLLWTAPKQAFASDSNAIDKPKTSTPPYPTPFRAQRHALLTKYSIFRSVNNPRIHHVDTNLG